MFFTTNVTKTLTHEMLNGTRVPVFVMSDDPEMKFIMCCGGVYADMAKGQHDFLLDEKGDVLNGKFIAISEHMLKVLTPEQLEFILRHEEGHFLYDADLLDISLEDYAKMDSKEISRSEMRADEFAISCTNKETAKSAILATLGVMSRLSCVPVETILEQCKACAPGRLEVYM